MLDLPETPGQLKSRDFFDWDDYETRLLKGLEEAVERFAANHPNTEFYGLCIDCNAEYGDVLMHLNTEDNIKEYGKWDVGDWSYFDVIEALDEKDNFFSSLWNDVRIYIIDKMFPLDDTWAAGEDPAEDFMVMINKVIYRLRIKGIFNKLNTTPDFSILVINHDEDEETALARTKRITTELGGSP